MSFYRIAGAILILLLVSALALEVSGLGLSSYFSDPARANVNYFPLIIEAVAIAVIAIALMVIMFTLFSNVSTSRENKKLSDKYGTELQETHQKSQQAFKDIQQYQEDAREVINRLHQKYELIGNLHNTAENRTGKLEETAEKLYLQEVELKKTSDSIATRLNHVQNYWDEQLEDTVTKVKHIRQGLNGSLSEVDQSLARLKEQEVMAQQFTRKLVKNYEEQAEAQRENNKISEHVRESLEATLQESTDLLSHLKQYNQNADEMFSRFTTEMDSYESRTYEYFEDIFSSTDLARDELTATVQESQSVLEKIQGQDKAIEELSSTVQSRIESLEVDRLDILTKTLSDTSDMCDDLKKGISESRNVLYGLKSLEGSTPAEHQHEEEELVVDEPKKSSFTEGNKLVSFFSNR